MLPPNYKFQRSFLESHIGKHNFLLPFYYCMNNDIKQANPQSTSTPSQLINILNKYIHIYISFSLRLGFGKPENSPQVENFN